MFLGSAEYDLELQRLKISRKPCQLPLESDISKLFHYTLHQIAEFSGEYSLVDNHSFIALRNATMSRLSLLNARRGGEGGRLLIEEWKEADNDGWIDKPKLRVLSNKNSNSFPNSISASGFSKIGSQQDLSVISRS